MRKDLAQKREELREVIRDAAIEEFAEFGLRGATTQGIADRAGINKTKLHYHIDSKEELYQEALDHILSIWSELFEGNATDHGPESFLSDYIARKVAFSLDHPEKVKMFISEVMRGAPMLRDHWAGSREDTLRAARRIEEWAEAGLIRRVDPLLLQFHIWAMTESWAIIGTELRFMLSIPDATPLDRGRITAEVTALVLQGIRP